MKQNKFEGFEGISFGITSGVITILGVILGLAATGNKNITLFGVLIVGMADALSDAAGMYVSEESEYVHTHNQIIKSALFTFAAKLLTAFLLVIPFLILALYPAVAVSLSIGLVLVGSLGYYVAKGDKRLNIKITVFKYVLICTTVAIISYILGTIVNMFIAV